MPFVSVDVWKEPERTYHMDPAVLCFLNVEFCFVSSLRGSDTRILLLIVLAHLRRHHCRISVTQMVLWCKPPLQ